MGDDTFGAKSMADEENVKSNTDETLASSSSDDDDVSHVNGGESDEGVKTFKDLVRLFNSERTRAGGTSIAAPVS